MLSQEEVDFRKIAELINSDPTFCARVLREANSIEFGLHNEICDSAHALAMLGVERTRHVTLAAAMAAWVRGAMHSDELRYCWRHMVACAIIAKEMASICGFNPTYGYTAGLLHDIGRLGLLRAYPHEYQAMIRDAAEKCIDLLDYEQETFGVNHCEAGRWLAEKWALPDWCPEIAGRHHDPQDGAELGMLTIVHAACRLADALGYDVTRPLKPVSADEILAELPIAAQQRLRNRIPLIQQTIETQLAGYERPDTVGPVPGQEQLPDIDAFDAADPLEAVERATQMPDQQRRGRLLWVIVAIITLLVLILALRLNRS